MLETSICWLRGCMCSVAFSPLVQAYLSRFLRLVWRINQPFVPRNMARLKCLVCSSLPVSEVRRASSRALFDGVACLPVSVCACSKVFEVYVWAAGLCTVLHWAKLCTHIAPREAWGRSIFEHFSSIAHERQNVDDGRTMILWYIQRHRATQLASVGLAQARPNYGDSQPRSLYHIKKLWSFGAISHQYYVLGHTFSYTAGHYWFSGNSTLLAACLAWWGEPDRVHSTLVLP